MKKSKIFYPAIFFCMVFFQFSPLANGADETGGLLEIIDNQSVIKMVKAGLSEEVVIGKIKTSKTGFDLTTDGLIKLKENGVNNNVIEAMMQSQNPLPSSHAQSEVSTSTPPPPEIPTSQGPQGNIPEPSPYLSSPLRRADCKGRLAEFLDGNPDFDPEKAGENARMGSFQLGAKNKIQVFGSLSERSAKCFPVKRRGQTDSHSDNTLVSFDGRMFIFHDFYDVGKDSAVGVVKELPIGNSRTPYIKNASVTTQITNPASSERIIIKQEQRQ